MMGGMIRYTGFFFWVMFGSFVAAASGALYEYVFNEGDWQPVFTYAIISLILLELNFREERTTEVLSMITNAKNLLIQHYEDSKQLNENVLKRIQEIREYVGARQNEADNDPEFQKHLEELRKVEQGDTGRAQRSG